MPIGGSHISLKTTFLNLYLLVFPELRSFLHFNDHRFDNLLFDNLRFDNLYFDDLRFDDLRFDYLQ